MKKIYVRPEIEIDMLRASKVIAQSATGTGGTGENAGWGDDEYGY